ncbi:hypothetical protein UACE39S_01727 [Ureibacillus acetophenoni]
MKKGSKKKPIIVTVTVSKKPGGIEGAKYLLSIGPYKPLKISS